MRGALTERLTIVAPTITTDTQGGRSVTWAAISGTPYVWAKVEALSGDERLQATAITALVSYRVTMPYRADLTPAMRLSWRPYRASAARTLQILGAPRAVDAQRAYIQVDCGEVADA